MGEGGRVMCVCGERGGWERRRGGVVWCAVL